MNGLLLVVKPPGMTSHDVVEGVRRLAGVKVGHTGTLDPAAAGLLVVCLGRATRLAQYLVGCDKTYRAELTFGTATDTGDAEGQVTAQAAADQLTAEAVAAALAGLEGEPRLPVPRFSAVKQEGRPLYRKARKGEDLTPPERVMPVRRWELLEFSPGPPPVAQTELECGSGTYVRSLVEAAAEALGTVGFLSFLVRTRVGRFELEQARTLEQLEQAAQSGAWGEVLVPPAEAVGHLPELNLTPEQRQCLVHGGIVTPAGDELQAGQRLRVLDGSGRLAAVVRMEESPQGLRAAPETVLGTDQG